MNAIISVHKPEPSISRAGLVQLALSVLLLSSAWPAAKYALSQGATPLWFAAGRGVLSFVAVTMVVAAMGRLRLPGQRDLPTMAAVGTLQLALFFVLAHLAVAWVPAGRTAILANTTTIFVVPLSLIFLRERMPARRWLAAGIGLCGVAVLTGPWAIDWADPRILVGHAMLLGAGLAWSVAILVTRAAPPRLSMFELLPGCFLLGSAILIPVALVFAPHGTFGANFSGWLALAYIGGIAGPVGTWCVLEATAKLPAVVSSVGFLATPAAGLVLSNLFLDEPFTPDLLLGSAMILAGVAFAIVPPGVFRRHIA